LRQALLGGVFVAKTLSGSSVQIDCKNEVVSPATRKRVRGEGMRLSKTPDVRGDLLVKFNIAFPSQLTDSQRIFVEQNF
jgi:DnaJ-class molecular chaperone